MNYPLNNNYVVSADIGGSHITAAVCDVHNHAVIRSTFSRAELNSKSNANQILTIWINTIQETMVHFPMPVSGLSFAMPGPFDYQNGICYIKGLNKYEALYGMDLRTHLAAAFDLPVSYIRFRNDAEATIAGEVLAGAGKGFNHVMGITLGTGFGSARFQNNQAKDLNLGSEAFKDSIADNHLSTRWFLKRYYELTGLSVTGVRELAEIAKSNSTAKEVFKEFALNMSDFLSAPVGLINPDVLLICGNIARASGLFLSQLKKRLNVHIQLAQLGEEAALIGAAALFATTDNLKIITNLP
jgi:glucokinase